MIPQFDITQVHYELPADRIALFPLEKRDDSKLMIIRPNLEPEFEHKHFYDLPEIIPPNSLLIINSSKVIRARIFAQKASGGKAEILLIDPVQGAATDAMSSGKPMQWHCIIGGKKISEGMILHTMNNNHALQAEIINKNGMQGIVALQWKSNAVLSEVLDEIGTIPLPPYLNREAEASDTERYQTVYAKTEGSVAAPTAGLHFTQTVLQQLQNNHVGIQEVTLHVGLGTFKPFEEDSVEVFAMHKEQISIEKDVIASIRDFFLKEMRGKFICVGTTSCRTLESLFWFGIALLDKNFPAWHSGEFSFGQWDAYRLFDQQKSPAMAFDALLSWMNHHGYDYISGDTALMIIPGFQFGITEALITNFHQPKSTLLFLVSAFMGIDVWKSAYETAQSNQYRFLSYGDSSIIFR